MSKLGDLANAALNAIGIESLEDKLEAQKTGYLSSFQDYDQSSLSTALQDIDDAQHVKEGGVIDSQGHHFRGTKSVYEDEDEVSVAQAGDPRKVGGPGYVQVGVNEFIPAYT